MWLNSSVKYLKCYRGRARGLVTQPQHVINRNSCEMDLQPDAGLPAMLMP